MANELQFALYAIKKNIQSSAELRTSFLMNVIGMFVNNTAFILLWVFFVKSVGVIGGWTAADIIGLQGYTSLCYGVVFSTCFGIRKIPDYISSGVFDRFMLSPKNLLMRTATSAFSVSSLGDIIFGVVCLCIYAVLIHAGLIQVALMLAIACIASIIFLSAILIINSRSFFFSDSSAVTGSLFELFLTPSLFHGGAFQGAMRFIFTFIIPSLLVGAIPVEIVRDASFEKFLLVGVLAVIWFLFSIYIFNRSVRHYESSNFMTFGS